MVVMTNNGAIPVTEVSYSLSATTRHLRNTSFPK